MLEEGLKAGIPVPALDGFRRSMEEATGVDIESGAEDAQNFVEENDAEMARNLDSVPAMSRMARQLEGYVMDQQEDSQQSPTASNGGTIRTEFVVLLTGAPLLLLLVLWRRRHRGGAR